MIVPSFNKLTPAQIERLNYLSGECGEVIQAISKIISFGWDSTHEGVTNRERLEQELGDVWGCQSLLTSPITQDLDLEAILVACEDKRRRMVPFLKEQPRCLMVELGVEYPHKPLKLYEVSYTRYADDDRRSAKGTWSGQMVAETEGQVWEKVCNKEKYWANLHILKIGLYDPATTKIDGAGLVESV